jgi:hypothetical protein
MARRIVKIKNVGWLEREVTDVDSSSNETGVTYSWASPPQTTRSAFNVRLVTVVVLAIMIAIWLH